jgi:hypothetical protein
MNSMQPHQLYNGQRARLECGDRRFEPLPVQTKRLQLVFVASLVFVLVWYMQASLLPVWIATPDVNVNFLYNVIHGKNGKAH